MSLSDRPAAYSAMPIDLRKSAIVDTTPSIPAPRYGDQEFYIRSTPLASAIGVGDRDRNNSSVTYLTERAAQ